MDLSPLYGLRLRTDRLELRWPDEEELVALGRLARDRVCTSPERCPSWCRGPIDIGRAGLRGRVRRITTSVVRDSWQPHELAARAGRLGRGRADRRAGASSDTSSRPRGELSHGLLARAEPSRASGYGTEMRAAILELAFHGLGASGGALHGARRRPTRRCGSRRSWATSRTREAWIEVRGERRLDRSMRLTRDRWIDQERISVRISGLEPASRYLG